MFILVFLVLLFSVCREIFPYLVVVIGLENVLVLTKSVVSTPVDLEVKLRIAQGNFIEEPTITFLFCFLRDQNLVNGTAS